MVQRFNKFLYSSIIISVLRLLIGIIFLVFPETSFETITYVLASILMVNGIYFMIEKESNLLYTSFLTLGVVELLLGIVLLIKPDLMKTLFPIVMVAKSTFDLRLSLLLKKYEYSNWSSIFICSIISIICGLIIIINPNIGAIALTASLGILIIVSSVSNIIDTIIFKKNVNSVVKILKK